MAAPILLSLFCLVGLAQMVNGQTAKGVCLLLSALVLGLLSYGILSIPIHIIGIVDAALIAGKLNQGRAVRPWEFF